MAQFRRSGLLLAGRRRCGALPGSGMMTLLPPSIPAWCLSARHGHGPGPLACLARTRWRAWPGCCVCQSWRGLSGAFRLALGSDWAVGAMARLALSAALARTALSARLDLGSAKPLAVLARALPGRVTRPMPALHGMADAQSVPGLVSSARLLRGPFQVSSARAWPSPGMTKRGPWLAQPGHGQARPVPDPARAWPSLLGMAARSRGCCDHRTYIPSACGQWYLRN